jgi:hypothetical protein
LTALGLVAAILLTPPARAFDGNDELVVTLIGGAEFHGWYLKAEDGILVLSGDNRLVELPVAAIASVTRDGAEMPSAQLQAELAAAQAAVDAYRSDPPPHPPVGVVVGLSMVWGGAGHAALGDWRTLAGYSVVEGALLGTGALNLSQGGSPGVLISLGAVDLLFRAYAAADAARIAKGRRARLAAAGDVAEGTR